MFIVYFRFVVELPSISGKEPCRIEYNYIDENIIISPAVYGYESAEYNLTDGKSGGWYSSLFLDLFECLHLYFYL